MSKTRRLLLTIGITWVVLVVIGTIVIAFIPFPPGDGSVQSQSQTTTVRVLALLGWPVFVLVIASLVYASIIGRFYPEPPVGDRARIRGDRRIAFAWVGTTGIIVLALAIFGTVTLSNDEAAAALGVGGRTAAGNNHTTGGNTEEGSAPLEVQVIAQQWQFTYRYPSMGGFESAHLVLPVGREVSLHITSLDVVHSFWWPALGVKADAVPVSDNVYNVKPQKVGTYRIECSELCGLWHGAMSDDTAMVMSPSDFQQWAEQEKQADAPIMKYLPPYSHTYVPDPGAYGT